MPQFKPQKMVGWYDIKQLANTGLKVSLSAVFGSYADKRETIAAISEIKTHDYSDARELWIDYIADVGDGFNSTYTMANLLAQKSLTVKDVDPSKTLTLPKANILILGGDQVYPVATKEAYNNRFEGPYEAAWPRNKLIAEDDMYAIPGNHDWYDGLTTFIKLFCQNRTTGNWRTQQKRSYFALKLTANTWLWAIDIQLEADIDYPQLCYFKTVAEGMIPEDNIILCSAEPSWIYKTSNRNDGSYANLRFFEEQFIDKFNFKLILSLAGDLHHYARYTKPLENEGKAHKITAGGGGAFMHPTHNLPTTLYNLREGPFKLEKTFPAKKESGQLLSGNMFFLFKNPGFGCFIAIIYLLFTWGLYVSAKLTQTAFIDYLSNYSFRDIVPATYLFVRLLSYSPLCIIIVALFIFGFGKFCDTDACKSRYICILGYVHGFLHPVLICSLLWIFARLNHLFMHLNFFWMNVLTMLEIFIIGGSLASVLMGLYLIAANYLFKIHDNEAFSSLRIEDYKNFLRFHIKENKLTIFPIGVKKIVHWSGTANGYKSDKEVMPQLIEEPIIIQLD